MQHMMPRLRRHVDGGPGHVGLGGGGHVHLGRVQRDHICSVECYLAAQCRVLLSSAVLLSTTLLPQYHIKYVARAFFFLHTINAYEEADHVVVDICGYDR